MDDPRMKKALARYQAISPYLATEPARGRRGALLHELSARVWPGPDGEPFQASAETLRAWIRRYRAGGLDALMDKDRPRRGVQALSPETIQAACALKRAVPERSIDRVLRILEDMALVEQGTVTRSTLHRALRANGLSGRPRATSDRKDLDRFEAAAPNDLWQSDLLVGPWLPDPERPGKVRRAYLYAFLDDHSRLLLDGRFSFKGDLPALEVCFRRALQKHGVCRKVYYDNGQVYRSGHMKQIVAYLGIHRILFTERHRPEGHGKIEAFNRFVRSNFLAELKASKIDTLDALNEAFRAFVALEYNPRVHAETGQAPLERWRAGIEHVRFADEEKLRQAFLWREQRKADKAGILSLYGLKYQVGPDLAARRVEVRYDPEALFEVEIWHQGRFAERARPFQVQPSRRPSAPSAPVEAYTPEHEHDWLGHVTRRYRDQAPAAPDPKVWSEEARARRDEATVALLDLLTDRLDDAVIDPVEVRAYLARFGPFDVERTEEVLDRLLTSQPADLHVRFYLDAIREAHR